MKTQQTLLNTHGRHAVMFVGWSKGDAWQESYFTILCIPRGWHGTLSKRWLTGLILSSWTHPWCSGREPHVWEGWQPWQGWCTLAARVLRDVVVNPVAVRSLQQGWFFSAFLGADRNCQYRIDLYKAETNVWGGEMWCGDK